MMIWRMRVRMTENIPMSLGFENYDYTCKKLPLIRPHIGGDVCHVWHNATVFTNAPGELKAVCPQHWVLLVCTNATRV